MWTSKFIVLVTLVNISAVLVFAKDFVYYTDKCPAKPAAGWPEIETSCDRNTNPAKDPCCKVIKNGAEVNGQCLYGECSACSKLNGVCGGSTGLQCCPVENTVEGLRCKTNAESERVCTKCIKTGQTCKGTTEAGQYECCEKYWSCDSKTKKCTDKNNVGKPK